jgi:hypothetical protein
MRAIVPNRPAQARPYAWAQVRVDPNPPRVGSPMRITYPLANPDPKPVVVERIVTRIAQFGMGVPWEELAPIGPFELPPDPRHVVEAAVDWVPQTGGHRCIRAEIFVAGAPQALLVGRNLDVIRADAYDTTWRVPFHVGNPEPEAAPIMIRMAALDGSDALRMALRVAGRRVREGEPVWLRPGEVVPAELELLAAQGPALEAIRTVEATIAGRLIDGIQVTLMRPALVMRPPHPAYTEDALAAEQSLVGVR